MDKTRIALFAAVTAIAIVLAANIALAHGMGGKSGNMQGCSMMGGASTGQMDHAQMHKQMHGTMQSMHGKMQMQQMRNAHHGNNGMR